MAMPYNYFAGEVTLHEAHPWVSGRLIPEGPSVGPTTDGGTYSSSGTMPSDVSAPITHHQSGRRGR